MLLISSGLFAQYKPVLFGLRMGGNLDWMKPDAEQYEGEGVKAGFSWGFMSDFFIMENYSILTGFNVQYLNGKISYPHQEMAGGDIVSGLLIRNYNLQYIQIPVVLKMQAEISESLRLFGKIGLGTAFRLRAKAEDVFPADKVSAKVTTKDISDEITPIRESFLIGGGAIFTLKGSTALVMDLTFDNGFVDILKGNNAVNTDVNHKAVMNLVEVGVGIVF